MNTPPASATISDVVSALGGHLSAVLAPPSSFSTPVRGVSLVDGHNPGEVPAGHAGLVLGARRNGIRSIIRSARRSQAAALLVPDHLAAELESLPAADRDRVALLCVSSASDWDHVRELAAAAIASIDALPAPDGGVLFGLARTLMATTGGSVSIEDAAHRVLAYAGLPGEADELRVHSILGRQGPEDLLRILRDRGVFEQLRLRESVVSVPADAELGWNSRIAAGIFAADQYLGTIWIQQGSRPLEGNSEAALIGAVRLAAYELEATRIHARTRSEILRDVLTQRISVPLGATELRTRTSRTVRLASVSLADDPGNEEGPGLVWRGRLAGRLELWAAAFRTDAVVSPIGSTMYVLVPDAGQDGAAEVRRAIGRLSRDLSQVLHAGVSSEMPFADLKEMQQQADASRSVAASAGLTTTTAYEDVRSRLALGEVVRLAREAGLLRHDGLDRLFSPSGGWSEQARTLLAFLELEGDARATANLLHVHVNTVRYRVSRAATLAGLNLEDPDDRLLARLVLRSLDGVPAGSTGSA